MLMASSAKLCMPEFVTGVRAKFLYLPIEIWSREFHAKTLLALYGASNGWSVVIGPKSEMQGDCIVYLRELFCNLVSIRIMWLK